MSVSHTDDRPDSGVEERPERGGLARAPVTAVLIGVNLALYLVEVAYPPIVALLGEVGNRIALGEYYRLLTSAFVHQPPPYLAHVVFNMLALWVFGRRVEPMLGTGRYLLVYLFSALGGSTVSYVFLDPRINAIGASGAIFGLLGAVVALARRARPNLGSLGVIVVLNMGLSFTAPHVDWYDHLGGFAAGGLLAAALALPPEPRRRLVGVAASAVMAVALAGSITYRSSVLRVQVSSVVGSYVVTGTMTSCTGFTPAGCAKVANLRAFWTISDCTDSHCTLRGSPWGTPVVLSLTDGRWTATAQRDPQHSDVCRGVRTPTTDVLTLTPEVVNGVATIHGTLRTSAAPWGCRASEQVWSLSGSR